MAQSISVAIIDADKASAESVQKEITTINRHVSVAGTAHSLKDGHELIVKTRPTIVLLDVDSEPDAALGMVEKVLHQYPGTCIFATSSDSSSDNILRTMRAGCTEFLLKPVTQTDLANALQKFGRIAVQRPVRARDERGSVVTVFSPKGGMGTTTVATNLAVCLHQRTKKPVVLVDLDLEAGDAAMFLNVKTKYSISDVTSNIARLDKAFLEGVLAKHSSGIYFLAEPEKVEEAEEITAGQVREVLGILKTMFAYVVIDTGIGYDEINLAAFDSSDAIFMVGMLSLPAIRNLQKALDVFERLGYGKDKVRLIINRYLRKTEISIEDAEKALDYKIFWRVPNSYNDVMASINRGLPLSLLAPHSEISRSFKDLSTAAQEYVDKMSAEGGRSALAAL